MWHLGVGYLSRDFVVIAAIIIRTHDITELRHFLHHYTNAD